MFRGLYATLCLLMMHFTDDTDIIEIPTHAETSEKAKTLLLTKTGVNIEESESQPKKNKKSKQEWPLLHEGIQSLKGK